MRNLITFFCLTLVLLMPAILYSQVFIVSDDGVFTFQPDMLNGKDAFIKKASPSSNFGNANFISAEKSLLPTINNNSSVRSLIEFDLTFFSSSAIVSSAKLTLYGIGHRYSISNASYLQRVISSWDESTVTWNNQPPTSTTDQISLDNSISGNQDYILDVTTQVQDMIRNPQLNYGWMLKFQDEVLRRNAALVFASCEYDNDPIEISKRPKLEITLFGVYASADVSVCNGASTLLAANGAAFYTWSPATGLDVTTGNSVSANPGISTTYTVEGTSGVNSGFAIVTITVNPSPSIILNPSEATINSGSSATITASAEGGSANTYSWAPTAGLDPASGNTVIANPLISTTYTVIATDANGCTNFNTVSITVNPFPTVTVSTNSPAICIGNSTELIASGADSYTWLPEIGLNIANEASVFASPTETTTYTVTGTNSFGLSASATITITVNPIPMISLNASSTEICRGGSVLLSASGLDNNSGYSWLPAIDLDNANGSGVTASPRSTTSFTVTGIDANNCSNVAATTIIVHGPVSLFLTSNSNICKGSSINLVASSTGEGLTTYSWSPADGLNTNAGSTVIANPEITTEYTVTATNENNCVNQATTTVTVNTTPSANAGADKTICKGANTTLTASGGSTYFWSSPVAGLSNKFISSPVATPIVSTTYTVTVSNGLCSASDAVSITVNPAPQIDITVSPETTNPGGNLNTIYQAYGEQSLTLSANITGDVSNYLWSPATGLTCTDCLTTIADPLTTTTYTLTATGSDGCRTTETITIYVVNVAGLCPG